MIKFDKQCLLLITVISHDDMHGLFSSGYRTITSLPINKNKAAKITDISLDLTISV